MRWSAGTDIARMGLTELQSGRGLVRRGNRGGPDRAWSAQRVAVWGRGSLRAIPNRYYDGKPLLGALAVRANKDERKTSREAGAGLPVERS